MNPIRYSTPSDIPQIRELMGNIFGDNLSFMKLFFRFFYNNNVLLYFTDSKIVSMAFLLPATMKIHQKETPLTYLYACATDKQYRRMGLMKQIIDKAYHDSFNRNEAGIFLLPANEQLYKFYESNGFEHFFYCKQTEYQVEDAPSANNDYQLIKISGKEYWKLRTVFLQGDYIVHYPLNHFTFLESWHQGAPSGLYAVLNQGLLEGITFVEVNNSFANVRELIFFEDKKELLSVFRRTFNRDKLFITTQGEEQKSALIRWNPLYENIKNRKGYFNFPLD